MHHSTSIRAKSREFFSSHIPTSENTKSIYNTPPSPITTISKISTISTMGDNHHDVVENDFLNPHKHEQYDLNNKILLTTIISLSLVVMLVTILHLYARCLLQQQTRRREALHQLEQAVNNPEPTKTGLDPAVIATLPIFSFGQCNASNETGQTDCAICLSVLENDDMAMILPNCKHIFHMNCIDAWLESNSTCPICRRQAEPRFVVEPLVPAQPSAPLEHVNPIMMNMEGSTSENPNQNADQIGSGSRLSSFRRSLIRERSSHTIQYSGEDVELEDLERQ